jgi:3D (Asp-Asp-Asp) domain-containing protein
MMLLSRSLGRKIVATGTAAVAFAFLYEATILDSRYAARQAEFWHSDAKPAPGARLKFTATAYCRGTTTASGVNVRNGIAAADPDLLPVGSVIQVDRLGERYNGIYTIMDTGPAVQGRRSHGPPAWMESASEQPQPQPDGSALQAARSAPAEGDARGQSWAGRHPRRQGGGAESAGRLAASLSFS